MTDVRERVARAICRRTLLETKQDADEATVGSYWKHYLPEADDALSAIGYEEIVGALEEALSMLKAYEESATGESFNSPRINDALRKARGEP